MVKFIQIGGNLFIGDIQPNNPNILIGPRIVVMTPIKPGVIQLNFGPLVGEPKEMEIHEKLYSYNVTNSELLAKYIEITTGLILTPPSGSVIPFPKEKMN